MSSAAELCRDRELEDVLRDLEARLDAIAEILTPEYDDELAVVEALAAPYTLAFVHEIRRLDELLLERRRPAAKNRKKR